MTAPLPAMGRVRVRRRILHLIHERPGIDRAGLVGASGLSLTVVTDAISALRDAGRIRDGQPVGDGRRRRYYPADISPKTTTTYQKEG